MDAEIDARLVRANSSYNKLTRRLWRKSGIRLMTKIAVYKAAVLSYMEVKHGPCHVDWLGS